MSRIKLELTPREAETIIRLLEQECSIGEAGDSTGEASLRRTAKVAVRLQELMGGTFIPLCARRILFK